ncbi:MAG: thiamine pyrophosphate-dependent dehydrogenase E1 component subunit alpha [Lacipirellulaceae bacterium]
MKTLNNVNEQTDLLRFYRSMLRIRLFEEAVADVVEAGEIRTPCHFCIGQEAPPVGVCEALTTDDQIFGAHRSHGHYLAKGGDMQALMAEIFCRSTGCCGGRGGSMHVIDTSVGVMGTVPIVAATIPIAVGAALAAKLRGEDRVAVSFFGDGATEEGHFHESLNLAGVNNLPVLFVCENNLYSSHMGIHQRRREDNILKSAEAHGIVGESVDGNDVTAVFEASKRATARARAGAGPTLLECRTFRWRGHVGPAWDYDVGVKRKDELKDWIKRDPLLRCRQELVEQGVTEPALADLRQEVEEEVAAALEYARNSPEPMGSEVLRHVYSEAA